jgi:hypothetical protein
MNENQQKHINENKWTGIILAINQLVLQGKQIMVC